jgi:head-tail adaptor
MTANALTDRVAVQTRTRTRTATGHSDGPWTQSAVLWGRAIPVDVTNAARQGQRLNSEITHKILVRGKHDWSPDRVRFIIGGVTYTPLERPMYYPAQGATTVYVKEEL